MRSIRGRKAFTMIELIIVIVILGILAGIAIVGYGAVTSRAKESSLRQAASSYDRELRALAAFEEGNPRDYAYHLELEAAGDAGDMDIAVSNGDRSASVALGTAAGGTAADANATQFVVEFTDSDNNTICLDVSDDAATPGQVIDCPVNFHTVNA